MAKYSLKKDGDNFFVYEDNEILTTPGGKKVRTLYENLAERIVHDLNKYGNDYHSVESILSWHYTMIDNFATMGHDKVKDVLESCFLQEKDWTCDDRYGEAWGKIFGYWPERREQIIEWLEKTTEMQMTAAACIGNSYNSINLAFVLATIMEKYEGEEREQAFVALASAIEINGKCGPTSVITNDFKTFELYYGIHLDQNGPILKDIIDMEDFEIGSELVEQAENRLNVDNLTEYSVTVEQLVGRNYYHYTNAIKDEKQPCMYTFADLDLDTSDEESGDEEEAEIGDEYDEDDLADYLPDDCWVKRFVDSEDCNVCYLLYLVVEEDGSIVDSGCIEECTQRGFGGSIFIIPGAEIPGVKSYDYNSEPPKEVIDDLKRLFDGRTLPLTFSFIGRRLPQAIIDDGGNGGDDTNYTYALQSAYRLAYMHMSIDTDENGVIENFDYSTYQSSGSAYGDMFSRPMGYSDRYDEAMDMLLYLYDKYTDEELKTE